MFKQSDLDRLLDEPIGHWSATILLGGVLDYLRISEDNLSLQSAQAVNLAQLEASSFEVEPSNSHLLKQLREHHIDQAKIRFEMLSQSVRYAALVAYVTAVERCCMLLKVRSLSEIAVPKRTNASLYILDQLDQKIGRSFKAKIDEYRSAVTLRNCVVHSAGQVTKGPNPVRKIVEATAGLRFDVEFCIGEVLHFNSEVVMNLVQDAQDWVPRLERRCIDAGVIT